MLLQLSRDSPDRSNAENKAKLAKLKSLHELLPFKCQGVAPLINNREVRVLQNAVAFFFFLNTSALRVAAQFLIFSPEIYCLFFKSESFIHCQSILVTEIFHSYCATLFVFLLISHRPEVCCVHVNV